MLVNELNLIDSKINALRKIEGYVSDGTTGYICAINANILVHSFTDENYRKTIGSALFNFCDSTNIWLFNNLLNTKKVELTPGPDIFRDVLKMKKYKSFFLGTSKGILEGLQQNLITNFDDNIAQMTFYSPPFLPVEKFDYKDISKLVNDDNVDIIWVALGAPKQEIFMHLLSPLLRKGIMIGVGAAFNFYSGIYELKRAPEWIKTLHLEWLFRAVQEPAKILPRQLKNSFYLPQIFIVELFNKLIRKY